MKKSSVVLLLVAIAMAPAVGLGQVIIRGTEIPGEAPANSASISAVHINTGDRNIVPLIKEDKETRVNPKTQESQSITKVLLNDGSYFNWRNRTTVTKGIAPGQTVSSSVLVEADREGQGRVTERADTAISRSDLGRQEHSSVYRRNSSGEVVLDHVVVVNTVNKGPGVADTASDQRIVDVNNNLIQVQQISSTAFSSGEKGQMMSSEIKAVDHRSGQTAIVAQETTSVVLDGNTKQIDSVISAPGQSGWEATSRMTTIETKVPVGSSVREIIVFGLPAYATKRDSVSPHPLMPQTKIIECEVHNFDGTSTQEWHVYHQDVNGEWVPETFSTKEADKLTNN